MIGIQAVTGLVPGLFQEDSNTGEIIWGIIRYYLKDYQGAIALYNELINLDPHDARTYQNREGMKNG